MHQEQRTKVAKALMKREEVKEAMNILIDTHIDKLGMDKISIIYSFMIKAAYPVTEDQLRKICKAMKRSIIVNHSENKTEYLTMLAITLKLSAKFQFDKLSHNLVQEYYKENGQAYS